jgi:hypothetical protein
MGRFEPNANLFAPGTISPSTSIEGAVGIGMNLRRNWDNHRAMEAEIEDRKFTREMAAKGQRIRLLMEALHGMPETQADQIEQISSQLHSELTGEPGPSFANPEIAKRYQQYAGTALADYNSSLKAVKDGTLTNEALGDKVAFHATTLGNIRDPSRQVYDMTTGQLVGGSAPVEVLAEGQKPTPPAAAGRPAPGGDYNPWRANLTTSWANSPGDRRQQAANEFDAQQADRDARRRQLDIEQQQADTHRMNAVTNRNMTDEHIDASKERRGQVRADRVGGRMAAQYNTNEFLGRLGLPVLRTVLENDWDRAAIKKDYEDLNSLFNDFGKVGTLARSMSAQDKANAVNLEYATEAKRAQLEAQWNADNPGREEENPFDRGRIAVVRQAIGESESKAQAHLEKTLGLLRQQLAETVDPNKREDIEDKIAMGEAAQRGEQSDGVERGVLHPVKRKYNSFLNWLRGSPRADGQSIGGAARSIQQRLKTDPNFGLSDAMVAVGIARSATKATYGEAAAVQWDPYIAALGQAANEKAANVQREEAAADRASNERVAESNAKGKAAEAERKAAVEAFEATLNKDTEDRKAAQEDRRLDQGDRRIDLEERQAERKGKRLGRKMGDQVSADEEEAARKEQMAEERRLQKESEDALERASKRVEKAAKASAGQFDEMDKPQISANAASRLQQAQTFQELLRSGKRGEEHANRLYTPEQQADLRGTMDRYYTAQEASKDDPEALTKFYAEEERRAREVEAGPPARPGVDSVQQAMDLADRVIETNPKFRDVYNEKMASLTGAARDRFALQFKKYIAERMGAQAAPEQE